MMAVGALVVLVGGVFGYRQCCGGAGEAPRDLQEADAYVEGGKGKKSEYHEGVPGDTSPESSTNGDDNIPVAVARVVPQEESSWWGGGATTTKSKGGGTVSRMPSVKIESNRNLGASRHGGVGDGEEIEIQPF